MSKEMLKEQIVRCANGNKTRLFHSQPLPEEYSRTRWADTLAIVTPMQQAFINALIR